MSIGEPDSSKRKLSDTEIKIIERDSTEQRTLSAELNDRASLITALVAIAGGLALSAEVQIGVRAIGLAFLVTIFLMLWRVARGEDYEYPKVEPAAVEYMDKNPQEAPQYLEELNEKYYRALMNAAWKARESNKEKSERLKILGPASVAVILLILAADLLQRFLFSP